MAFSVGVPIHPPAGIQSDIQFFEYSPNLPELEDFNAMAEHKLVDSVRAKGACTINMPDGYKIQNNRMEVMLKEEMENPSPQRVKRINENTFVLDSMHSSGPQITRQQYKDMSGTPYYSSATFMTIEEKEKEFWKLLNSGQFKPLYGFEQKGGELDGNKKLNAALGSLFTMKDKYCNPLKLGNLLIDFLNKSPTTFQAPGIATPFAYFSLLWAAFAWHVEDGLLHSLNVCHVTYSGMDEMINLFGCSKASTDGKLWYIIAPKDFQRACAVIEEAYKNRKVRPGKKCKGFAYHKQAILHPKVFRDAGIEVGVIHQRKNQMLLISSMAFHMGFSLSYSVNEAMNFGFEDCIINAGLMGGCTCLERPPVPVPIQSIKQELYPHLLTPTVPASQLPSSSRAVQLPPTEHRDPKLPKKILVPILFFCREHGCDLKFISCSARSKHESTHKARHECDMCHRDYGRADTLANHKSKKHSDKDDAPLLPLKKGRILGRIFSLRKRLRYLK